MRIDSDISHPWITGLTRAFLIPQASLIEMDLRFQLPNASAQLFLPSVHNVPNGYKRSAIAIPSCSACFWDHEKKGTIPYWKAEWTLALMTRCPDHFVVLSEYCRHCSLGLLSVVTDQKHGRLVIRCSICFQAMITCPGDPEKTSPCVKLIASLGTTLITACRNVVPDPMWLGPVDATTFISVIEDLIWILTDGNPNGGFSLLSRGLPPSCCEMSLTRRTLWNRPLNLLSVRHREVVATAVAVALLGNRITSEFGITPPQEIVSQPDSYPFSFMLPPIMYGGHGELAKRIKRWPAIIKERARLHFKYVS